MTKNVFKELQKAPVEERKLLAQKLIYPMINKNGVMGWGFVFGKKSKPTIYWASQHQREKLEHILETGNIPDAKGKIRGNIYHPGNQTLRMPRWLGRYKFISNAPKQSS